jgi:hypothetical protein
LPLEARIAQLGKLTLVEPLALFKFINETLNGHDKFWAKEPDKWVDGFPLDH